MTDKERAERAEACCAEMREVIKDLVAYGSSAYSKKLQALSTDCGQGWLSPEKAKELENRCTMAEADSAVVRASLESEKRNNNLLVEAIEFYLKQTDFFGKSNAMMQLKDALSTVKGSQ